MFKKRGSIRSQRGYSIDCKEAGPARDPSVDGEASALEPAPDLNTKARCASTRGWVSPLQVNGRRWWRRALQREAVDNDLNDLNAAFVPGRWCIEVHVGQARTCRAYGRLRARAGGLGRPARRGACGKGKRMHASEGQHPEKGTKDGEIKPRRR